MQQTVVERVHMRIRAWFMKYQSPPTLNDVWEIERAYRVRQGMGVSGSFELSFRDYYHAYFPPDANWEIRFISDDIGVGLFAREDIRFNRPLRNLTTFRPRLVNEDRTRDNSMPTCEECNTNRVRLLRGPAAFMNHACDLHANVKPKDDWHRFLSDDNIEQENQLYISYGKDKPKEKFPYPPCEFCTSSS